MKQFDTMAVNASIRTVDMKLTQTFVPLMDSYGIVDQVLESNDDLIADK